MLAHLARCARSTSTQGLPSTSRLLRSSVRLSCARQHSSRRTAWHGPDTGRVMAASAPGTHRRRRVSAWRGGGGDAAAGQTHTIGFLSAKRSNEDGPLDACPQTLRNSCPDHPQRILVVRAPRQDECDISWLNLSTLPASSVRKRGRVDLERFSHELSHVSWRGARMGTRWARTERALGAQSGGRRVHASSGRSTSQPKVRNQIWHSMPGFTNWCRFVAGTL